MDEFSAFSASVWKFLNYPFITLGKSQITFWAILFSSTLVIAFILVSAKIKHVLLSSLDRRRGLNVSNWRASITIGYYLLLGFGLVAILQTTGLDLSLFTVLTGAIGIGVGFGMQTIMGNFISGIILLLEKPLRLGDRIEVGDVSGNVHSISVRATTIITNDNVSIIVPNHDFISKQVINWSYSGNSVRISISVSVTYDEDPDLVERVLLQVAAEEPGVLKSPEPKVRLTEFGENGLKYSLLVWTTEFNDRKGALRSLLNFRVLKAFRANNIKLPFPHREVRILHDDQTVKGTL